jgi:hypothetical protein
VQAWLDKTKLRVSGTDYVDLEGVARTQIYAHLTSAGFDTSTWVTPSSTPDLIRHTVGLLVAAWLYRRTYSEDVADESAYSNKLEAMATSVVTGITGGMVDVPGAPADIVDTAPIFYPNDQSTADEVAGTPDTTPTGAFRMGMVF